MLLHAQCNPWSEGDTDYRKILNENPAAKYYVSKARQVIISGSMIMRKYFNLTIVAYSNKDDTTKNS